MNTPIISDINPDKFINTLRLVMQNDPTFKDYNFDASGLSAIMRLLATHSTQLGFLSNMQFNEGFMKTAESYNSVASRSAFLSYTPDSVRSAQMTVDIKVTAPDATQGQRINMPKTTTFIGSKEGQPFFFSPDGEYISEVITADNVYEFKNVTLVEGEWITRAYNVEGSAISSYEIDDPDIDINTMIVNVRESNSVANTEEYVRYRSAFDLDSDSKLYYIDVNHRGNYEIEFGDGILSKRPDDGNIIIVEYLTSKGEAGNDIRVVSASSAISGLGSIEVTTLTNSNSGSSRESAESIRLRAPVSFASGGLAVAAREYANIVKDVYPQADAISWGGENNEPALPGFVVVAVKPHDRETLTDAEKTSLQTYIQTRNVGSVFCRIVDVEFYYINLTVSVTWGSTATNTTINKVKADVRTEAVKYSSNVLEKFGGEYDNNAFQNAVDDALVNVSRPVAEVQYERRMVPSGLVPEIISANFYHSIAEESVVVDHIGGNIRYLDRDGQMYCEKDGVLDTNISFGTVDYTNGIIAMNPVLITETIDGNYVRITAKPDTIDQSVTVGQRNYLTINDVEVNVRGY